VRVRIVSYEDVNLWILGKFALRLQEQLARLDVDADIAKTPDLSADINHHIIYTYWDGVKTTTDTVMLTHFDSELRFNILRRQVPAMEMGVCMSRDTLNQLVRHAVPRSKLCFVNPGHDGVIEARKLVLGITSKVQPTGCKRETILADLADSISGKDFKFAIMGAGWQPIVDRLRDKGIEVDYYDTFEYGLYCRLIPSFDYYVYFGQDEGSMGFVDAVAAGVPTIVTPQGFHLDAPGAITHPFDEPEELVAILQAIAAKRRQYSNAVGRWTWEEYARKHMAIWDYLLQRKAGQPIPGALSRDLQSVGVTRHPSLAAVEAGLYRVARGARNRASALRRRIERWT
jgi:hypothetical protein